MYLARKKIKGVTHYLVRESCPAPDGDYLISRDLLDLGDDPAKHIIYPGGRCYYVDEEVEAAIRSAATEPTSEEIDEIFWPFVKKTVQRTMEPFRRSSRCIRVTKLSEEEKEQINTKVHMFDKRRMYYLRYGGIDQSRIWRVPPKLFRVLLKKSRDEIEQYFMEMERVLEPREYRQYVYVIFDLPRFFTEMVARTIPQALNQDQLDEYFLEEIKKLNGDKAFWTGMEMDEWLHDYLTRYVIMFFDYDFGPSSFMDDYIRQFINGHRQFRFPQKKSAVSLDEASEIFGVSSEELKKMSKREFTHLYRVKAHEYHPDKGGEQETFVKLTEAYKDLLRGKK